MAGPDTVKRNYLGNFNNFIFGEGKGTPDQNCGAGEQSGGIQSENCFTQGTLMLTYIAQR